MTTYILANTYDIYLRTAKVCDLTKDLVTSVRHCLRFEPQRVMG